jgi:hypothetical protein
MLSTSTYISTYTYAFTACIRDNLKIFSLRPGLSLKQFGSQILEVTLSSKCNKVSLKQQRTKSKFKHLAPEIRPIYFCLSVRTPRRRTINTVKGKRIPLQAWTGPEGSRRLRLPDFKTIGTLRR